MEQAELFKYVVRLLEDLGITYMVVGSLASGAYGEPRLTHDIDIVLDAKPQDIEALCAQFPPDQFYVSREAAIQAVSQGGQFNIIHPASGNKIDFMTPPSNPWGFQQLLGRKKMRILPDQEGYTARPEDIIISKMIYYREGGSEKHMRDITGILKVSPESVDEVYINEWAEKLGLIEIWKAIVKRI